MLRLRNLVPVILPAALVAGVAPPAMALPRGTKVVRYARNLNFPIDMAWVPGTKKIFFTEKSGAVRVMVRRRLKARPCVRLNVSDIGERGALGIVLHPNFKKNKRLYVYYTNASPLQNRVTRFTVRKDRCKDPKHIVRGLSTLGKTNHNGGHLEFVQGKLLVSTGDGADPNQSQNTKTRLGKILRYGPGGGIPNDNPFGANNPVWAYGLRNPFGLTHEPGTGRVFATDNGPHCDDELNRIRPGRNYGWGPGYQCGTAGVGPNPRPPLIRWSKIIVPTDPVWYKSRMAKLSGSLYVGEFGTGRLRRVNMNANRTKVRRQRVIHRAPSGIVDVSKGPGGRLYFMTRDSIYRIVPT